MPLSLARCEVLTRGWAVSIMAPQGRQPRAADALVGGVRTGFANRPEPRCGGADLACTAALRAACARVARTSPARLAVDQDRAEGHGATLDGMARVPGDPPRRASRAPVSPASRRPVCPRVLRPLQRGQALAPMVWCAGGARLAREGPGSVSSTTSHWASWRHQVHRNGSMP